MAEYKETPISQDNILKIKKECVTLKCAICDTELIKIHSAVDINKSQDFKCKCPLCNNFSFVVNIKGKAFFESIGFPINNIEDGVIYVDKVN